ncbi:hypothetical protein [Yoonia sediminilitoris]|nr:hypothetical protein [Yoonia sediminilitoris]
MIRIQPQFLAFGSGLLLLILSFWLTAERLISIGILDASLTSENIMTRKVAQFEVSAAKYILLVLALSIMIISMRWKSIEKLEGYQKFMSRDLRYPLAYERILRTVIDRSLLTMLILIISSLIYIAISETIFSEVTIGFINAEDGLIEYGSALMLLMASLIALINSFSREMRPSSRGFFIFLTLLFFAMCGEEVSWGQRIFGFETPKALAEVNVQEELNLHNMFGYFFDHLFILLFFLWGCVLPAIYHITQTGQQILRWLGIPLPSIGLSIAMLLITLYQGQIVYAFFDPVIFLLIPEVREFFSATAFLLMMLQSYGGFRSSREYSN